MDGFICDIAMCKQQSNEYWLAKKQLALLLKHRNGLFYNLLSGSNLIAQPYRKHLQGIAQ